MPERRRTVFAAAGTLFVVVLAGLGIRVAGGHDPALGTRAGAGGAAAITQAQTERSTDDEWSDESGALVAPDARQAPAQAPTLQSGAS